VKRAVDAKCFMDNSDCLQPSFACSQTTISANICIHLWKNDFAKVSKNLAILIGPSK